MPNICTYSLLAKGRTENLQALTTYLQTEYDYPSTLDSFLEHIDEMISKNRVCTNKHYLGFGPHPARVFAFETVYDENEELIELKGYGECAWSVATCMLEGYGYIKNTNNDVLQLTIDPALEEHLVKIKQVYPEFTYTLKNSVIETNIKMNFTSIEEIARTHHLLIQILSDEPGVAFSENIIIDGDLNTLEVKVNETVYLDLHEITSHICETNKIDNQVFDEMSKDEQLKHVSDYLANDECWLKYNKDKNLNTLIVAKTLFEEEYITLGLFEEFTI